MFAWLKEQLGLGWTVKDTVRAIWTFVATFAVTFGAAVWGPVKDILTKCAEEVCPAPPDKAFWLAAALAAGSAAFIAVKNFVLKDRSTLKG